MGVYGGGREDGLGVAMRHRRSPATSPSDPLVQEDGTEYKPNLRKLQWENILRQSQILGKEKIGRE